MIKKILYINIILVLMFTGCFEEEKKVVKKRKPVEKMASKVLKDVKKEKPLSVVIEEDGIVVDG
ncbi:MAG: hypothetical protein GY932_08625, partial [Arcobacter sp.]|nr:hypothetical protein [Arcobacter sp.]